MRWFALMLIATSAVAAPAPKAKKPVRELPAAGTAPAAAPEAESPEARAATAKVRGDAAMVAGRPADALRDYEVAMGLSSDPALVYNRARALQALERYPEASRTLEKFAAVATPELKARVPKLEALLLELRSKSSALDIRCAVEGAEVRIDQTLVGRTPMLSKLDWNTGKVTVTVTLPEFHTFTRTLDLPPGGVALIEVQLNPLATTGLLRVKSSVPGASLTIDDLPKGTAPYEGFLALGTHRVDVRADGYDTAANSVVISSTEPRELTLELAPTPKFYQRWYFWTAIGAVVGGSIATAVLLTTERPGKEGTLGISAVGGR
jgi:hypothetical protein